MEELLSTCFPSRTDRPISVKKQLFVVQVLAEQCRRLGILIENTPRAKPPSSNTTASSAPAQRKPRDLGGALEISTIHQRVRNLMKAKNVDFTIKQNPVPHESPLPKGWEERFDPGTQRKFYIDHGNKVSHADVQGVGIYHRQRLAMDHYHNQLQSTNSVIADHILSLFGATRCFKHWT